MNPGTLKKNSSQNAIKVVVVEKEGKKYMELIPKGMCIANESDAVDVVGLCGQYHTNVILLHDENLTDEFFDLKTGVAGNILQKFITYRIRVAALLSSEKLVGRFKEMVEESNRGTDFRVFFDKKKAEEWLWSLYRWPVG